MLKDGDLEIRDEERTRCEVWTRVMGYHRPVSAFNAGKQAEHGERRMFSEHPEGRVADQSHARLEAA
jgi:hypothetical protein